eukprot:6680992-Prymnesium_polylepis.1
MVQQEAGGKTGVITAHDESPSPDLCEAMWKVHSNGKWLPQPQLCCVEVSASQLPPPLALRIERAGGGGGGGSALGRTVPVGLYRLSDIVQGKPAWAHVERANTWLAFAKGGWFVQPSSAFGSRKGWIALDDECAGPHLSCACWELAISGEPKPLPELRCVEVAPTELPPPLALKLCGATGAAAKWASVYQLQPGRTVQGRPVWKACSPNVQLLAYSGFSWMVQAERSLGTAAGFLTVQDDCGSPDQASAEWPTTATGCRSRSCTSKRSTAPSCRHRSPCGSRPRGAATTA